MKHIQELPGMVFSPRSLESIGFLLCVGALALAPLASFTWLVSVAAEPLCWAALDCLWWTEVWSPFPTFTLKWASYSGSFKVIQDLSPYAPLATFKSYNSSLHRNSLPSFFSWSPPACLPCHYGTSSKKPFASFSFPPSFTFFHLPPHPSSVYRWQGAPVAPHMSLWHRLQ